MASSSNVLSSGQGCGTCSAHKMVPIFAWRCRAIGIGKDIPHTQVGQQGMAHRGNDAEQFSVTGRSSVAGKKVCGSGVEERQSHFLRERSPAELPSAPCRARGTGGGPASTRQAPPPMPLCMCALFGSLSPWLPGRHACLRGWSRSRRRVSSIGAASRP